MSSNKKQPTPFLHTLISGGVAGVSEILVMYPLDIAKTRAQLNATGNVGMLEKMVQILFFSRHGISD